jgi:acyl dehydratase
MLSMAFVGQMLTDWMGLGGELKRFQVRFSAMVWPGDVITSNGTIVRRWEEKGEGLVELALESKSQEGTVTVKGTACVRLPRRSA